MRRPLAVILIIPHINVMKRLFSCIKNLGINKQLIILTALVLMINLILVNLGNYGYGKKLAGHIKSPDEVRTAGVRTILFSLPLFSIILGSIISLFLSKKKIYKERFINSSLIILICFYTIMIILEIRSLII